MTDNNKSGQIDQKFALAFLAAFAVTVALFLVFQISEVNKQVSFPFSHIVNDVKIKQASQDKSAGVAVEGIVKFASEDDFKNFLALAQMSQSTGGGYGGGLTNEKGISMDAAVPATPKMEQSTVGAGATNNAPRASQTNVQVAGIDEPDIVKTDGKRIYYSRPASYYFGGWNGISNGRLKIGSIPPEQMQGETKIVNAYPPDKLAVSQTLNAGGDLLISGSRLAVFAGNQITGFDVTDPAKPVEAWKIRLEDNNEIVASRLYGKNIYLVSKSTINVYHPCPIKPLAAGGSPMIVQCGEIYHSRPEFNADAIYTALAIDITTGAVEKSLSFVGSSTTSLLYMSQSGIYVTWGFSGDYVAFLHSFFNEKATDLVPAYMIERVGKLAEYDLSQEAKFTEITMIIQNYRASLSDDEKIRFDNEISNRMVEFAKIKARDLIRTGIIKLSSEDLSIQASTSVPGTPLNQFALDEYLGNLRIATTVGGGWSMLGSMGESANDIYVLSSDLAMLGSIQGLGLDERIYSARFVNDLGYLVTFKQTDPFFVIDLSDPKKPALKGELKIPGYSAYLHPLDKNLVLGIGKENWKVKISLFDVSLPADPKEVAKYNLDDFWSEVETNHHAFMLDAANKIFFVPGSKGGYFYSYKDNNLMLKKAVAGTAVKRAVYLGDFYYVVYDDKISVMSAQSFEKVNEVSLY